MFAFRQLHQKREGPRRYQRRDRLPVALSIEFAHSGGRHGSAIFSIRASSTTSTGGASPGGFQQGLHALVVITGQGTQRLGANKAMGNL